MPETQSVNRIELIGYVKKIYQNNYPQWGPMCKIIIVTERKNYNKDRNDTPPKDSHNVAVWRDEAVRLGDILKPGMTIRVVGELQYGRNKNDPNIVYSDISPTEKVEIVSHDTTKFDEDQRKEEQKPQSHSSYQPRISRTNLTDYAKKPTPAYRETKKTDYYDDDIPF
jgi:single-stranded DNA-binding protein